MFVVWSVNETKSTDQELARQQQVLQALTHILKEHCTTMIWAAGDSDLWNMRNRQFRDFANISDTGGMMRYDGIPTYRRCTNY